MENKSKGRSPQDEVPEPEKAEEPKTPNHVAWAQWIQRHMYLLLVPSACVVVAGIGILAAWTKMWEWGGTAVFVAAACLIILVCLDEWSNQTVKRYTAAVGIANIRAEYGCNCTGCKALRLAGQFAA